MEKYKIIPLDNTEFNHLIISNTYENPINQFLYDGYIPSIQKAKVIFDLTIVNGLTFNRFISAIIENHKLLPNSIQVVNSAPKAIELISKNHFKSNSKIIEHSVIPNADKYIILK